MTNKIYQCGSCFLLDEKNEELEAIIARLTATLESCREKLRIETDRADGLAAELADAKHNDKDQTNASCRKCIGRRTRQQVPDDRRATSGRVGSAG